MAAIDRLDTSKPLAIYGVATRISDVPSLVDLARQHRNERLRLVSEEVGDAFVLLETAGEALLEVIRKDAKLLRGFEASLQSLCVGPRGPLLTACLTLDQFIQILHKTEDDPQANGLTAGLREALCSWCEHGAAEVFIDGYEVTRVSMEEGEKTHVD